MKHGDKAVALMRAACAFTQERVSYAELGLPFLSAPLGGSLRCGDRLLEITAHDLNAMGNTDESITAWVTAELTRLGWPRRARPSRPRVGSDLELLVIYERPADYPESFVVRAWRPRGGVDLAPDLDPLAVVDSLAAARDHVAARRPDAVRIERDPKDDPVIVESWL